MDISHTLQKVKPWGKKSKANVWWELRSTYLTREEKLSSAHRECLDIHVVLNIVNSLVICASQRVFYKTHFHMAHSLRTLLWDLKEWFICPMYIQNKNLSCQLRYQMECKVEIVKSPEQGCRCWCHAPMTPSLGTWWIH